MVTWRLGLTGLALLLTLHTVPAKAESGCPPPRPEGTCRCHGCERVLAGHTLPVAAFLDTPLVMTWVGVQSGVQIERAGTIALGPLSTEPETLTVVESMELSLAWRNWLALNFSADGLVAIGPDKESLILTQPLYLFGFRAGLQARLYRSDELGLLVSARVFGGYGAGELYDLIGLVQAAANAPAATLETILAGNADELAVAPLSEARVGGSVSAAQALWRYFSLQASAALRYRHRTLEVFRITEQARQDLTASVLQPEVALALAADGIALKVPAQLVLGYRLSIPITDDDYLGVDETHAEHLLSLGIYYSGRPDLQLGAVGFVRLGLEPVPIAGLNPDGSPQVFGLSLILRTFW